MRSIFIIIGVITLLSCDSSRLEPVSVGDFSRFVEETGYVTDAERYGWSIIQLDVLRYDTSSGLAWTNPTLQGRPLDEMPVTQVSFNDAQAYCKWSNTRLPSYDEYWDLASSDQRPIVSDADRIEPLNKVHVVGNVWDITTTTDALGQIRLAGGSYLCNTRTCNGISPDRILYVDKETGNSHIGFAVMR